MKQRGATLIEAMVALVIMAFGMLAMVGLQGNMRRSADLARQRGEAMRLAQQDMELQRAFSVLTLPDEADPGIRAYDGIKELSATDVGDPDSNATFSLQRDVLDIAEPPQKAIRVTVSWKDRAEGAQALTLDSFVSRVDPGLSGSLSVAPEGAPTRRPGERSASIPVGAKDLGDKSSVFKPQESGTVAWVFDNISGLITGKCLVPFDTATSALTSADVETCRNNTNGYLLSGFVRFSSAEPPDPDHPAGTALPLDMVLKLTSSGHPTPAYECYDNAPASTLTTMTAVNYHCVVYPNDETPRIWSGRLLIDGIALGGSNWRICRYSADYDGDGHIGNAEHPQDYSAVAGSLSRQNFLVVKAASACPAGHAPDAAIGRFVDSSTVQHQIRGLPYSD